MSDALLAAVRCEFSVILAITSQLKWKLSVMAKVNHHALQVFPDLTPSHTYAPRAANSRRLVAEGTAVVTRHRCHCEYTAWHLCNEHSMQENGACYVSCKHCHAQLARKVLQSELCWRGIIKQACQWESLVLFTSNRWLAESKSSNLQSPQQHLPYSTVQQRADCGGLRHVVTVW